MLPSRDSGNVYTVLLYRALESVGLVYEQFPFSLRWVLRHRARDEFHYVHFHWPEVFFNLRPRAWTRLFGLKHYLWAHAVWVALRVQGYRILWTVHEVDVHDATQMTALHAWSRRTLWRLAEMVFFHTPDVRAEAERRWGPKAHAHTIPIGSYEGAYPDDIDRISARARLAIPADAVTFVFFGNVRPYKGIDLLLEGFRGVQAAHPQTHLIIAGKPYSAEFAAAVHQQAKAIANVHLHLGYVEDGDIQIYLRAADCFVAPYKYIETCSAIYLALAYELPIIIKSEGNVVEFADQPIGIFLGDAAQVGDAMQRFVALPAARRDAMRAATRAAAANYAWERLRHRYREAFDAFEAAHTAGHARV